MIDHIDQAVARLRAGELIVMPTETVYGLAADASNPEAVARIFALKERPSTRPLIVHVADASSLDAWARTVTPGARALAARFWPGPLTLVLPRAPHVPDAVTAGLDTVALRVPSHPIALAVIARFGGGIAAPSANRFGRISPTTADHVRSQFGPNTPLLLDGGPCEVGIESTIVACLPGSLRVLRSGSIAIPALEETAGCSIALETEPSEVLRAPGQDLTHYAPLTPTSLAPRAEFNAWRAAHPGRVGFLGFAEPGFDADHDLRLTPDAEAAARELYAALHALDAARLDAILVEEPPDEPSWLAVRDRLRRATAGRTRWADAGPGLGKEI